MADKTNGKNLSSQKFHLQDPIKDDKIKDDLDVNQAYLVPGKKDSPYGVSANLDIDEKLWNSLESDITDYFQVINRDKEDLVDKMVEYQLAIQGEPTEEDYSDEVFTDSCKLRSTLTGSNCRIIENKITSTILVQPYFIAEVKGNKEAEVVLRDYANHKCKYDFDFRQTVRDVAHIAVESPAAILVPEKVREIRTDTDYDIYYSMDEFTSKYKDAEEAGLTEAEYDQKRKEVREDIDSEGYHECYYNVDVVIEKTNVNVVNINNYAQFPWNCTPEKSKLQAYKIEKIWSELVMLEKDHQVKNVAKLKKFYVDKENSVDGDRIQEIQEEKINVQTNSNDEDYKTKVYTIYKGWIRLGLNDDQRETDYEFWYAIEEGILLRLAPYASHYKKRPVVIARIWKKTNSWLGQSIPEQLENPQNVCDTLLRQYIDGNSMANVPEFVGSAQDKANLERQREDFKHKVGKIWWLKNPSMFQSLRMQRPDGSSFMSLLQYIVQDSEARTGASRTAAGQPLAEDPNAPGNKTMALLQQSDIMIDAYIDNLRPSFDEMMKHAIKQDRQYMKNRKLRISGYDESGRAKNLDITRESLKFADPDTKFILRNQKVDDNLVKRKLEARQDLEMFLADPMFQNRPEVKAFAWRNYLMQNDRYSMDEIDKLIPSDEQLAEEQAGVQQEQQIVEAAQGEQQELLQESQRVADQQEADIDNELNQEI